MIYTVTFNPSLDYIVSVDHFKPGITNRTDSESIYPGGKGLNVSSVLWNLGYKSIALGFIAGFTGSEIENRSKESGFLCDFITIESGISRINIKIRDSEETEINGQGPVIDKRALKNLYRKLSHLTSNDILILAGSIPKDLSEDTYSDILKITNQKNILSMVDATGNLLLNTLPLHPFLIKPNRQELEDLFGIQLQSHETAIIYARKLQELGARNILVSLGKEGAILVPETGDALFMPAPEGRSINSVGSGDAMVAGFLAGWLDKKDYYHALKRAVASGSACAFSERFASKEKILELYKLL